MMFPEKRISLQGYALLMPKGTEPEGDSGFGAEFFVFKREAYLHTLSEENGKNKQNIILWKKTKGFQHQIKMSFHTENVCVKTSTNKTFFACGYAQRHRARINTLHYQQFWDKELRHECC